MGAQGYVAHANVSHVLARAILNIAAGQLWVSQEVLQEFLSEVGRILRKDIHHRQSTTPREDEILELVRRRLSNKEIADLLEIRVSTVKFHISNIFSKMHASSRRELADGSFRKLGRMLAH
jgi:NarL family two-component system response regulator LiaR